jgi:hypothetical protein
MPAPRDLYASNEWLGAPDDLPSPLILKKPLEQPYDLCRLLDMSIVPRTRDLMRFLTMLMQLGVAHHRIELAARKDHPCLRTSHKTPKRCSSHLKSARILRQPPTLLALRHTMTQPLISRSDCQIETRYAPIAAPGLLGRRIPADRPRRELPTPLKVRRGPGDLRTHPGNPAHLNAKPPTTEGQCEIHTQRMSDDVDPALVPDQPGELRGKAPNTIMRLRPRTSVPTQIRRDPPSNAALLEHALHAHPHTCSGPKPMQEENSRSTRPTFFVPEHPNPNPTAATAGMMLQALCSRSASCNRP